MTAIQTEAAPLTNTDRLVNAAHRLMQAERTGDKDAIRKAEVYVRFYEHQVSAEGALERAERLLQEEDAEARRQENEVGNAYHSTY